MINKKRTKKGVTVNRKDTSTLEEMTDQIRLATSEKRRWTKKIIRIFLNIIATAIWATVWVTIGLFVGKQQIVYVVLLLNIPFGIILFFSRLRRQKQNDIGIKNIEKIDIISICLALAASLLFIPALLFIVLYFDQIPKTKQVEIALDDSRAHLIFQYSRLDTLVNSYRSKWNEKQYQSVHDRVQDLAIKLEAFLKQTGPFNDNIVFWPQTEPLLKEVNQLIEDIKV